jgi:hypothetical protein
LEAAELSGSCSQEEDARRRGSLAERTEKVKEIKKMPSGGKLAATSACIEDERGGSNSEFSRPVRYGVREPRDGQCKEIASPGVVRQERGTFQINSLGERCSP